MSHSENTSHQAPNDTNDADELGFGFAAGPATPSSAQESLQGSANVPPASGTQEHQERQIADLQARVAQLQEQFLRAHADSQNAKRRAEEEISKARKFALEAFAESLLPVCDSLEAGLAVENATPEQLREGVQATLRQLQSALERHKVCVINPGPTSRFDPNFHQAISAVACDQEANTVVSVLQKGYLIAERVLRPALVTVAQ